MLVKISGDLASHPSITIMNSGLTFLSLPSLSKISLLNQVPLKSLLAKTSRSHGLAVNIQLHPLFEVSSKIIVGLSPLPLY